jgi:energy-coupling factor transporter ATP-binding protein EcfA2
MPESTEMKKQIIALRGKSGVGKSTTLQLLYKLLISNPGSKPLYFESVGRKLDFLAIVSVEGFTIGLFNRGDQPATVQGLLERLVKKKCDVIVCASRTKGEVDKILDAYARKYKISTLQKKARFGKSEAVSNLTAAHSVASMVYAAIDA